MADNVIYSEEKWVIVDRKEGIIAMGTPRNRRLLPIDTDRKLRVLTYSSQAIAENAYTKYGFYTHDVDGYLQETYGVSHLEFNKNRPRYLKAVKVQIKMVRG